VSGTFAGPAVPLPADAGAFRLPRLWAAVAVAIAMHAALLATRPGGITGSHVAPAARAMAVRVLGPLTAEPAATSGEREPAPMAAADVTPLPTAAAVARSSSTAPTRAAKAPREAPPERASSLARNREPDPPPVPALAPAPAPAPAPAAAMPSMAPTALPAAPDYAFGVRLDPGPRPLDDIEPAYPDVYLREGTVVLRLLISETGHVDDVAVVRAEPRGVFEQAALDAFGKARFAPGLAAGVPVKSQITVEVRFMPINRGAGVSGRTY
jgi:TonB family protein